MRFIILCLAIGFLASCDNTPKTPKETTPELTAEEKIEAKRVEEVMKVHDDVMPKMADISRVRRILKEHVKKNPDIATEKAAEINAMITHLDAADEGMMTWMGDWTDSQAQVQKYKEAKNHTAMMKYLDMQMISISKVRDDMLHSIKSGEELAKSLIEDKEE